MNSNFRNAWGLILSLMLTSNGFAEARAGKVSETNLEITVLVYNYALVPPKTLLQAQGNASRILREAGIKIVWANCPTSEEKISEHPVCQQIADGPTKLQLTVLPRHMAARLPMSNKTFGFSLPAGKDGFGVNAYVFAHRVDELVE